VAAQLAHRKRGLFMRLDETSPWSNELADAFTRLRTAVH
jgi:hypothetical protein